MKLREGFVSNSSSSSFIVALKDITAEQLTKIENHISVSTEEYTGNYNCTEPSLDFEWEISKDKHNLYGKVFMDNFDMYNFMEAIGVQMDKVTWSEWPDWE